MGENITGSKDSLPKHVAVIMDGNNRWARSRGLPGSAGHRAGAEVARELVTGCVERGIPWLTLFAFSSENWLRPDREVKGLMALFLMVLRRKEIRQFHQQNVRLQFIGNRESFMPRLRRHMKEVEDLTRNNTGTTVTVAADYGGRWDVAQACQRIARKVEDGTLSASEVTVESVHEHTSLAGVPDPDICIRTGGEVRISNFLLWQMAYTELYFTDCYWPDFNDAAFQRALDDYSRRQRRYGHLDAGIGLAHDDGGSDELPRGGHVA